MLVDVNLEALAIAFVLPVSDAVADVVEERTAAEIKPANEHAAEMADVTDIVSGRTEEKWYEKLQTSQEQHKRAHGHAHGQKHNADLAVGEQNGAGGENAEDCAGSADRRDVRSFVAEEYGDGLDKNFDEPRTHAGQKVIANEASPAPNEFQFAAKHPEHEHVEQHMQEIVGVVQKEVGEGLQMRRPGITPEGTRPNQRRNFW